MFPRASARLPSPAQRKQLEEMLVLNISGLSVLSIKNFLQNFFSVYPAM